MPRTLTLRAVPDSMLRSLRARAQRNHRSLQEEILSILRGATIDRESLLDQITSLRAKAGARMTLDEIQRAIEE